ncbi:major royal jelly protein 1-like [Teleopsis dalmanni]|uniref:major royal jelly protein 1-like n=1 Tax=Teleopsis dalmanni TaxID=139649 RepID=UPI0018CF6890|nr:major royal jelly protein 1-like [Teleopsis dalmanni]
MNLFGIIVYVCGILLIIQPLKVLPNEVLIAEWDSFDNGVHKTKNDGRPLDFCMEVQPDGFWRKFITISTYNQSMPFTLATLDDGNATEYGAVIRPYPNMEWHTSGNCRGIVTATSVEVEDDCRRLWVLDGGRNFTSEQHYQVCPPKIVVFDLVRDVSIFRYEIPFNQYSTSTSSFNVITLATSRACNESIAYLTNSGDSTVTVFSLAKFSSHVVTSELFKPTRRLTTQESLYNDILGISPNPLDRQVYMRRFESNILMSIPETVLHFAPFWQLKSLKPLAESFIRNNGYQPAHYTALVSDKMGNVWCAQENAIVCWNPRNLGSPKLISTKAVDVHTLSHVTRLKAGYDDIFGYFITGISNLHHIENLSTKRNQMFMMPTANLI